MSAALDIITLVLIVGMTFLGMKKGLAKTVIQLGGGIVAIIIAFTLSASVGAMISNSFVKPPIRKMVANQIASATNVPVNSSVDATIENTDVESALTNASSPIQSLLKTFGTSAEKVMNDVGSDIDKTTTEYKNKLIDAIVNPVADGLSRIIAFIVLFLLASVLVFLISIPLGLVSKIPIIGGFNRLGGALLGFVQSIIILFILAALINLIAPVAATSDNGAFKSTTIEDTAIFHIFCDINPVKL